MRYKIVEHEGVKYGLRRGQTIEQLVAFLPEYLAIKALVDSCFPQSGDVQTSYLILTEYGLVDRSKIKRSHHKPRHGERPKLGPGSGRTGGARAAAHYRSHVGGGWVPPGTKPEDCHICRDGLEKTIRSQRAAEEDADDLPPYKAPTPVEPTVYLDDPSVCL
jgi:hypothetical protein